MSYLTQRRRKDYSRVALLMYGKPGFDIRLGGTPMEIPVLSGSNEDIGGGTQPL
jgi:hypothetical protein